MLFRAGDRFPGMAARRLTWRGARWVVNIANEFLQQLNIRVARLEEQVRVGKWVMGTLGTALIANMVGIGFLLIGPAIG